jgi:hypothetical protein
LLFIQDLTNGVASQSAISFFNKFIDIKSDIWFTLRLFLTLVQDVWLFSSWQFRKQTHMSISFPHHMLAYHTSA